MLTGAAASETTTELRGLEQIFVEKVLFNKRRQEAAEQSIGQGFQYLGLKAHLSIWAYSRELGLLLNVNSFLSNI